MNQRLRNGAADFSVVCIDGWCIRLLLCGSAPHLSLMPTNTQEEEQVHSSLQASRPTWRVVLACVCCIVQAMLDACERGDNDFVMGHLPRLRDAKDSRGMSLFSRNASVSTSISMNNERCIAGLWACSMDVWFGMRQVGVVSQNQRILLPAFSYSFHLSSNEPHPSFRTLLSTLCLLQLWLDATLY